MDTVQAGKKVILLKVEQFTNELTGNFPADCYRIPLKNLQLSCEQFDSVGPRYAK